MCAEIIRPKPPADPDPIEELVRIVCGRVCRDGNVKGVDRRAIVELRLVKFGRGRYRQWKNACRTKHESQLGSATWRFATTIIRCRSWSDRKSKPQSPEWRAQGIEERGAVFTRREVVDFILDLAGYTADKPLHQARLLEPSMGQGDFLTPAIDRLLEAYAREVGGRGDIVDDLGDCILAVELHRSSYDADARSW